MSGCCDDDVRRRAEWRLRWSAVFSDRRREFALGELGISRRLLAAQRVLRSDPRTLCRFQQGVRRRLSEGDRQERRDQAVARRLRLAGARRDRRLAGRRGHAGARLRYRRHRGQGPDRRRLAEAAAAQCLALHLDHRVPGAQGQSQGHQGLGRPDQARRQPSSRRIRRPPAARAGIIWPHGAMRRRNSARPTRPGNSSAISTRTCRCWTPARAARPSRSSSAASATCCWHGRTRRSSLNANSARTSSRSWRRRCRSWPSLRSPSSTRLPTRKARARSRRPI